MNRKMIMFAVLVGGMMGSVGLIHGAAVVDNDSKSKFNNEHRDGMWSRAAYAIEIGDIAYIKSLVPSKIARIQKRNFPTSPYSHKKTLFDIATFHAGNLEGKPEHLIKNQIEIVDYLDPQQEAKEAAAAPQAAPIDLVGLAKELLQRNDLKLASYFLSLAVGKGGYQPIVHDQNYVRNVLIPTLDAAIIQADSNIVSAIVSVANEAGYAHSLDLPARQALFRQLYGDRDTYGGRYYDKKGNIIAEKRTENKQHLKMYIALDSMRSSLGFAPEL